ncbi:hypothetical protein ACTXT7_004691 [Hymenolepis weldensis]
MHSILPVNLLDPAQNETVRRNLILINTSHGQSANEDTDILHQARVEVILTYGSPLGSLRYHTRMPYDSDYDLAIAQKLEEGKIDIPQFGFKSRKLNAND